MFLTRVAHGLTTLCTYIQGMPTSLEQGILPASIFDGGSAPRPGAPVPYLQLQGYSNIITNVSDIHPIVIPEGLRVNAFIRGSVMIWYFLILDQLTGVHDQGKLDQPGRDFVR